MNQASVYFEILEGTLDKKHARKFTRRLERVFFRKLAMLKSIPEYLNKYFVKQAVNKFFLALSFTLKNFTHTYIHITL